MFLVFYLPISKFYLQFQPQDRRQRLGACATTSICETSCVGSITRNSSRQIAAQKTLMAMFAQCSDSIYKHCLSMF